ncbi:spore coat protein YsxE [Thermoactinomyces sp. DSM 45891]|uniref:phosphotransferase n=1 Tax=Thermoactinomyces sp. DSM 45891 TaxID=1761907 RepID=UPI0009106DC6|nr:phosphotransferase [Thermoactinomyces sp. DSM 45891]SFX11150.1 spore coat protein YsxE [Thermoactinomyces sp. DSM 45891]
MNKETDNRDERSVIKQVCKQFRFKPQHVQKGPRNVWQVFDGERWFALKSTSQSADTLALIHDITDQIHDAGYPNLLSCKKTEQNETFIEQEGKCWYLTPWIQPQEPQEFDYNPEALVRSLGIFHKQAEPLVCEHVDRTKQVEQEQVEKWKGYQTKLSEYQEVVQNREYKSPFDKVYVGQIDLVDRLFTFAIKGLERFVEAESGVPPRYTLCHGRLHPSNVVRDDEQFYWIDFDDAEIDSPVRDLAVFLRRFQHRNLDPEEIQHLIEVYESENPLSPKEKKLLAIYLSYPENVLRLAHKYYDRPRIMSESDAVVQLESKIQQMHALFDVVKRLWKTESQTVRTKPAKKSTKAAAKTALKATKGTKLTKATKPTKTIKETKAPKEMKPSSQGESEPDLDLEDNDRD